MYIDISIDEILNRFIDNYEEKEIVGWTATAAGNGIHIEYEDKVLTWKDYEAIASDIYEEFFDNNEDVEPVIRYYENKYDITIFMEMKDNSREDYKYFIENNGTKIVKRPVKIIEKQKINFRFRGAENYDTYRWINV